MEQRPSTATAEEDDPTIRREVGFAKLWGYGSLWKYNLYAFRSTDPKGLYDAPNADPVGEDNDKHICAIKGVTVAAWGNHGTLLGRDKKVKALLPEWFCFGLTKEGQPKHPLYLPKTAQLVRFI